MAKRIDFKALARMDTKDMAIEAARLADELELDPIPGDPTVRDWRWESIDTTVRKEHLREIRDNGWTARGAKYKDIWR